MTDELKLLCCGGADGAVLELDEVDELEEVDEGAELCSKVVSAVCAEVMSLLERAVLTLDRKLLSGELVSVPEGLFCSISER